MPDIILFLFSLVTIVALVTYIVVLKKRLNNILKMYIQSTMNNTILTTEVHNLQMLQNNDEFLKFLSDTRTAAFEYIEEVQNAIKDFALKADHIIRTPDISPNTVIAYKKLLDMLPKDETNA